MRIKSSWKKKDFRHYYEQKKYNNAQDFISGNNPTVSFDTLKIMGTSEGYYLWNWSSGDYVVLCKHYDNKFILIGDYFISSPHYNQSINQGDIYMFEKPSVMADFSKHANFTIDFPDTINYIIPFDERSTTIDTLFDNLYHTYIFTDYVLGGSSPRINTDYFSREGWTYHTSYYPDLNYFSKRRMIEKLDNIENNLNP